ncbi:MAG: GNAT family N-acetyltransferase [Acidimicrobiales bacterium]|nr:GNAT family N-acetyltransferase [Acidimicrobiales bacterium]
MDDLTIRRAGETDVDELVRLRLAFLDDVRGPGAVAAVPDLAAATRSWAESGTATGALASWLARLDGETVAATSLALHEVPPLPDDPRTRDGYLLNVYVVPRARRRGIARALLDEAAAAAASLGVRRLTLFATPEGEPLYRSEGFRTDPRWMARPIAR